MVALNTWLTSSGDFYISLVGPDGQPVYYGQGALLQNDNSEVSTYSLAPWNRRFQSNGRWIVSANCESFIETG